MISVTGIGFSRARLDDQFSANFCVALSVHPGDQGAATFVVQAVRVDGEDDSPVRGSLPGGLATTLVPALSLFENN